MPSDDWAARRDPLLDRVCARGQELRRSRQMAMGIIAAAIVLLIAIPAVALSGGSSNHRNVNTIGAPTTQSSDDTTTAPSAGVVMTVPPSSTTTPPGPPTTARPTTTTTALACRNSYDQRCGPFYWDPAPGPNQPLSVHITYSPSNPRTGQQVTFHVVADDPDGGGIQCKDGPNQWAPQFGDGSRGFPCVYGCPDEFQRYGPWTPPAPLPAHSEGDLNHVYSQAGQYTVSFNVGSGNPCGPDPYGSQRTQTVTVDVSGPPVVTTTTR